MKKVMLSLLFLFYAAAISAADIAVITIAQGNEYKEKVKLGLEANRQYCQKHGYDYICCEENLDPSRHIYWSKIILALQTLENPSYKWVVWLDADTIVMNQDIRLEDLLDENVNLIIGYDWNGVNSGVFFIKNCDWSKEFLKGVYARTDCIDLLWPEQLAIAKEIEEKPENAKVSKIVPQRLFNAYPPELISYLMYTYQPGDFILHFASIRDNLPELYKKYSQQIQNNRNLITLDQYLGYYNYTLSPLHSPNNEGYMSEEQKIQFNERLSQYPHIESILEIGLNGGHSCENFFQSCKNLKHFASFDINTHPYTRYAVEYFKRKYKDKFEFIPGDSAETVPSYSQQNPHMKFDLIFVDGKLTYDYVVKDILNAQKLSGPHTILWVDDYYSPFSDGLETLQEQGIIKIENVRESTGINGNRKWAEARYLFN